MLDKQYVAVNKLPECGEDDDCFDCPYFDGKGGCMANPKTMGCCYCSTAYSDERLDRDNALSFCSIGKCAGGFGAYISAQSFYSLPPVEIMVCQWNKQHQCNHAVFRLVPKYCPMCGRLITENESYLSRGDRNT